MDLSVKYDTLQLSQQLLKRQATTHLTNMKSFVGEWCRLQAGDDIGVAFAAFIPVNEAITVAGEGTLELLKKCHQGAADKLNQTIDAYAEADKAAYEALASALQALGGTADPFEDPRDNPAKLGDSTTKAGSLYGGGAATQRLANKSRKGPKRRETTSTPLRTAQPNALATRSHRTAPSRSPRTPAPTWSHPKPRLLRWRISAGRQAPSSAASTGRSSR